MNVNYVGEGDVVLLAGGGRIYTDIAARFCNSERDLREIISSPYDKNIVRNILQSGHLTATEFDYFIFGIQGYSRVCEVQLVRKRLASYLIKSGRTEKAGKRSFDVVFPRSLTSFTSDFEFPIDSAYTMDGRPLSELLPGDNKIMLSIDVFDIMKIIEHWYADGIRHKIKEEDLRYVKPQATEFKAIIGMNAHALIDWFKIRCCNNAQKEIRHLANEMLKLVRRAKPDLFQNAGASCISLGYCPENERQNPVCRASKIPTHKEVLRILRQTDLSKLSRQKVAKPYVY